MSAHSGRIETVEDLRGVLFRGGFVPCDSTVCGCGSWHQRFGYPERMREIQELLEEAGHPLTNANGNLLRNAVAALIAERDALREALVKLVEAADMSDKGLYGTLSTGFVRDIASAALALTTGESA